MLLRHRVLVHAACSCVRCMFVRFCGAWQVHGPHGFRQRSIECLDFLMVDHENADLADMPPNGRASPKVRSILLLAGMYCRYRTHARTHANAHAPARMHARTGPCTDTYIRELHTQRIVRGCMAGAHQRAAHRRKTHSGTSPPSTKTGNPTQRLTHTRTRTRACAQELSELGLRVVAVMCGQALFDHVALIDTMLKQV
jgi:hypothetical protein